MQFNTTRLPLSELASALVFYWVVPWAGAIRFTTAVVNPSRGLHALAAGHHKVLPEALALVHPWI